VIACFGGARQTGFAVLRGDVAQSVNGLESSPK
jgi:hypothetical protein